MQLILALYLVFFASLLCRHIYERRQLPGPLDSLRAGNLHYLPVGLALGLLLPQANAVALALENMRTGLLSAIIVWFGMLAGLGLDLRRFRNYSLRRLLIEAMQALGGFTAVLLLTLAVHPLLRHHLGVNVPPFLTALILAGAATTVRLPDFIFHWKEKLLIPASDPARTIPFCTNAAALTFLTILSPFTPARTVIQLGPFSIVETASIAALLIGLGLLLGLLLNFIFGTFKESLLASYMAITTIAVLGGICLSIALPGLIVGFVGGAWFINTTVRRREALELLERTEAVLQPLFFILLGSLLVQVHTRFDVLLVFALIFVLLRSLFRGLSLFIATRLLGGPISWIDIIGSSLRPLGILSIALLLQLSLLNTMPGLHTLIAGGLLAAFFCQIIPLPRFREVNRPTLRS